VDGTCLAASMVAQEESFQDGEGTRAEDLERIWQELGSLCKLTGEVF
jgi:hypothetical protein